MRMGTFLVHIATKFQSTIPSEGPSDDTKILNWIEVPNQMEHLLGIM